LIKPWIYFQEFYFEPKARGEIRIFGFNTNKKTNKKTARSVISKMRGFFWRRHPRIFENVTLVARQREHFRSVLAILWVTLFPPEEVFSYIKIHYINTFE